MVLLIDKWRGRIQLLSHTQNSVVYAVDTDDGVGEGRANETATVLKGWAVWYRGEEPLGPLRPPDIADWIVRREAAIYEQVGRHDLIVNYLGLEVAVLRGAGPEPKAWAIRLERAPGKALRSYLRGPAPSERARLDLCLQFARAVAHVHSRGVVWGDLSTRNALVFSCPTPNPRGGAAGRSSDAAASQASSSSSTAPPSSQQSASSPSAPWRIKLCDFGTAALFENYDKDYWGAEVRYTPPGPSAHLDKRGDIKDVGIIHRELFALGSAICEITEWTVPYGPEHEVTYEEVQAMLLAGEWPDISLDNPAEDIIRRCWDYQYVAASEIVEDLESIISQSTAPQQDG
ncbi:serine/threonine protein kinase [Gaeumannomyces tritici R3-111a-1]|uniref:Serine/threonine protein kinase n=1 Tax=Gaeumannomyces tritici (strain R3-111a-1) TaxID=644352 RepID=J3PB37_GAET3|nr:serine/threonine protein kinase [Gaeumannomyces tritici R3-111a-1]EJT71453.1 serine/threonine protein kinase [Gaeumannomyces tritici R3-111a-1]